MGDAVFRALSWLLLVCVRVHAARLLVCLPKPLCCKGMDLLGCCCIPSVKQGNGNDSEGGSGFCRALRAGVFFSPRATPSTGGARARARPARAPGLRGCALAHRPPPLPTRQHRPLASPHRLLRAGGCLCAPGLCGGCVAPCAHAYASTCACVCCTGVCARVAHVCGGFVCVCVCASVCWRCGRSGASPTSGRRDRTTGCVFELSPPPGGDGGDSG